MSYSPQAVDPAMQAAHRRALAKRGGLVTVRRIFGTAPRTVTFSATVMAMVSDASPDSTSDRVEGTAKTGDVTETARLIIVMTEDLDAERFPLPITKNDRIILNSTGERLNVIKADLHKRAIAGAIEVTAAGIE